MVPKSIVLTHRICYKLHKQLKCLYLVFSRNYLLMKSLTSENMFRKSMLFFIFLFSYFLLNAQESTNASGGDAKDTDGSVAYSIGQVLYTVNSTSEGIVGKGVQQRYEMAKVVAAMETGLIQTPWSKIPALPTTVTIQTAEGQFVRVGVNWNTSTLNVFRRGTYTIGGSLILPSFIANPSQVIAQLRIQVLPKPAPRDFNLTNATFEGSAELFFISIGDFVVDDPVDTIHEIRLYGRSYDNGFFEIKGNRLFWSSIDPAPGRTSFTILVQITDRDGNTLEKFFDLIRIRPSSSELVISNTFTPNGDGANDYWGVLDLMFYQNVRIQIFDRGGLRVFYTEDAKQRWDGTHFKKELPIGAYYWIIEVGELNEIRRGVLNLLRK